MNQDDLDALAALKAAHAARFGGKTPHAEVVAGDLARVCALAAAARDASEDDWPEAWREILGAYTQGSAAVRPHQKLVLYAAQLAELLKMVEAGNVSEPQQREMDAELKQEAKFAAELEEPGDGRGDH